MRRLDEDESQPLRKSMERGGDESSGGHQGGQESLEIREWFDAVVDDTPPTAAVSMSARYPSDIARRVMGDAEARGVEPGVILREIVEAHYATLDVASDELITVRPADVVRALAQVARRERCAAE